MRGVRYLGGSTRKVAQLTGEFDRERGQSTRSQTASQFGLAGTDLGASFEHAGRVYFLFGDSVSAIGYNDVRPEAGDAIAFTTDSDPTAGLTLQFWTDANKKYRSPRVRPPMGQGPFEVPVCGLSVDGRMYVYFSTDHFKEPSGNEVMGRSVLTRLADENNALFDKVYDLSDVRQGGRFINVSTAVVDNSRLPGLPDPSGTGLLLWGTGLYRASSPYLAYMPLAELENRAALRYFSGTAAKPAWSPRESDAVPLFDHPQIGEFCVVWLADVEGWLMLYNAGQPRGINYRFSPAPWGEWSPSGVLFDPWCDGGYGRFMHASYLEHGRIDTVQDDGRADEWGGEYGPYVIERYTRRDATQLDVYFVMSTWNPYNTVLMRTTFALAPWRGWYTLPGALFPPTASIVVVSRDPDRMEVWSIGQDGIVRGNPFDGTWHGWYTLDGATFNPGARLCAVSRHPDRLEVWAVGLDGIVRGNWFDGGWHGWYTLPGATFGQQATLTAVSRHVDWMEVWGVGQDGVVRGNWFDGTWHGWYTLPGATFDQQVTLKAVSRHPDRMEIWAVGQDGVVRGNWFDGTWHGWYTLPGATFDQRVALTAVSRDPDRMEIWAVGQDGVVRGNWFDVAWHGWYALPDNAVGQSAPLAAVTRNPDRMEIWSIGLDGAVHGRWFDHGWHDWYTLGGADFAQGAHLAAVTRHPERMEVWSVGTDGVVRGNWFDAT